MARVLIVDDERLIQFQLDEARAKVADALARRAPG